MTKIFIICSVREATKQYRQKLEAYTNRLDSEGHFVYLPHRDTDQTASSLAICTANRNAIKNADEVHIFYSSRSQGTLFDMGVAFGLGKTIHIVEREPLTRGKSFTNLLNEWSADV